MLLQERKLTIQEIGSLNVYNRLWRLLSLALEPGFLARNWWFDSSEYKIIQYVLWRNPDSWNGVLLLNIELKQKKQKNPSPFSYA